MKKTYFSSCILLVAVACGDEPSARSGGSPFGGASTGGPQASSDGSQGDEWGSAEQASEESGPVASSMPQGVDGPPPGPGAAESGLGGSTGELESTTTADASTTGFDEEDTEGDDVDPGTSSGTTGVTTGGPTSTSTTSTSGGSTTGEPAPTDDEVCFLGPTRAYDVCVPLLRFDTYPAGYDYLPALNGNPNYRPPVAFFDLDDIPVGTAIAPNFVIEEIAETFRGQYAIIQPHALESLQSLRDAVGPIAVNSGYRPPLYNEGIGGATYSRHMYGDGFDLRPLNVSLEVLEIECTEQGGFLVEYETHVHCDFRHDPVDPLFFGTATQAFSLPDSPTEPRIEATIEQQDGVFTAPATGFDEGQPRRRWRAYDAHDVLISEGLGPVYLAPPGAAWVEVEIGACLELMAMVR